MVSYSHLISADREVAPAFQLLDAGAIGRHRHATGYAAIVLDGGYVESGDRGRMALKTGEIAIHQAWDAHQDMVGRNGSRVLNLPIWSCSAPGFYRSSNLDDIIRLAEHGDIRGASALLGCDTLEPVDTEHDWPELLVRAINEQPDLRLADWAAGHELRPTEVSSGFLRRYGVSPKRFRAEAKARCGWQLITTTSASLADIAVQAGFVDQAHMNRGLIELTGSTPGRMRETSHALRAP